MKKTCCILVMMLLISAAMTTIAVTEKNYNFYKSNNDKPTDVPDDWLVGADQYQTDDYRYGSAITPIYHMAQEFKPSKEDLTAVAIHLFDVNAPSGIDITIEIRESLNGSDLTLKTINSDDKRIKDDGTWLMFDFDDIIVTPEETYYIVCYASDGVFQESYCWFFDVGNKYDRGIAWQSVDSGLTWTDLEDIGDPEFEQLDHCFITYYQEPPESISYSKNNYPMFLGGNLDYAVEYQNDNILPTNCNDNFEWAKTYGGDEADKLWDVQETDDGGYIACGTTELDDNHCPWVLKVDSEGNELWDWTITSFDYGDVNVDITYCWCDKAIQTADGGYLICITAFLFNYNDEGYSVGGLLKLGSDGTEEWMKIFGEPFEWCLYVESVLEVEDGFIGIGAYGDPLRLIVGDVGDACLFKTDFSGTLLWHNEYIYSDYEESSWGFCPTNDGGYLLASCANQGDEQVGKYDARMIKTNAEGEKEWEKTFGGSNDDYFMSCMQASNGNYVMVGYTLSFGTGSADVWILGTDSNGNELWNKTYGEKKLDYCFDIDVLDDGDLILPLIINVQEFFGDKSDSWVMNVDGDGNVDWKHIYGGSGEQMFIGICSTTDGGCIASGLSDGGWDTSPSNALLVKYAAFQNQQPDKPSMPTGPAKGKPDTNYTFSTSSSDPDGDSISYIWDWGDGNFTEGSNEEIYSWSTEDKFEVKVMAVDGHGGESEWSDPLIFSTPKNKITYHLLLERLLSRFPILKSLI